MVRKNHIILVIGCYETNWLAKLEAEVTFIVVAFSTDRAGLREPRKKGHCSLTSLPKKVMMGFGSWLNFDKDRFLFQKRKDMYGIVTSRRCIVFWFKTTCVHNCRRSEVGLAFVLLSFLRWCWALLFYVFEEYSQEETYCHYCPHFAFLTRSGFKHSTTPSLNSVQICH